MPVTELLFHLVVAAAAFVTSALAHFRWYTSWRRGGNVPRPLGRYTMGVDLGGGESHTAIGVLVRAHPALTPEAVAHLREVWELLHHGPGNAVIDVSLLFPPQQPAEELTTAGLRELLGPPAADTPTVRFNAEGGFSVN
jgi:hypothetical protein